MIKKCPFCGADIEESARFCLYCTQSLIEKEQLFPRPQKAPQWKYLLMFAIITFLATTIICLGGQLALKIASTPQTSSVVHSEHTPADAKKENYVASSCTQEGSYDEVVYCSVCREELSRTKKTVYQTSHTFNQTVTTSQYLKSAATCTEPAIYYYSCACGEKGKITFSYGTVSDDHVYDQKNTDTFYLESEATETSPAVYYYSCICGKKGTNTFTGGGVLGHIHSFDQKNTDVTYQKSPVSCTEPAIYYYSCACGEKGDITFAHGEATGHSFASTWVQGIDYHWHEATCEHSTERSEYERHVFGTDNICDVCSVEVSLGHGKIWLDFTSLTMMVDDVVTLTATITPPNFPNQNITWSTSDARVVTVDANGTVTAVSTGEAVITVDLGSGGELARCTVTVNPKPSPTP